MTRIWYNMWPGYDIIWSGLIYTKVKLYWLACNKFCCGKHSIVKIKECYVIRNLSLFISKCADVIVAYCVYTQLICLDLFLAGTNNLLDYFRRGLLHHPPAKVRVSLNELLQECAYPKQPSNHSSPLLAHRLKTLLQNSIC